MNIKLIKENIASVKTDALIIPMFEEKANRPSAYKIINNKMENALDLICKKKYFKGKLHETYSIHTFEKINAEHIILVGLGKKKDFLHHTMYQITGTIMNQLKKMSLRTAHLPIYEFFPENITKKEFVRICAQELQYAHYSYDTYKSEKDKINLKEISFLDNTTKEWDTLKKEIKISTAIAESANFARDLSNAPSNEATPARLAQEAKNISNKYKMKCTVLSLEQANKMKMGAFYAVAKGSKNPAKFIIIKHSKGKQNQKPIVIIGKGITFDSGGISIKPSKDMDKMKHDMAGAASVLGIMRALGSLNLPVNVVGIAPATENLPGGNAYKPGDILKTYSGKTIEVLNTDAEGRLVLADALAYADKLNPEAVIDMATLTGACVVALGYHASGIMGNNNNLLEEIKKAGESSGERVWELPMWQDYLIQIKSDIADVKNTGGGTAGAITAGAFLKSFVKDNTPWIHIDIAGTAWVEDARPYIKKGATGIGVKLIMHYLLNKLNKK
ncbi:leucyl aminopeptidase [candidate division KSB1 bacterium]